MTKLSEEALEKAIKELNEPREEVDRLAAIDLLRKSFKTKNPDVNLIRDDDVFMLRFLRGKKFDQAKALATLKSYLTLQQFWPEFSDKIKNPVLIKSTLEKGVCYPLEGVAKNGSTVIVMRPGVGNCNDIVDMFAALYLTVDRLLENENSQVYGAAIIVDLAYFNSEMTKQVLPSVIMKMSRTMQDCVPMRNRFLNFTNEPKFFDAIFAIIQPFVPEKLKNRVAFHGKDFEKLYGFVDKSVLPFMFAGSGPEPDIEMWKNAIIQEGTAL